MSRDYICNQSQYFFGNGYICLEIQIPEIPETLMIEDSFLTRKTKFHVSLLALKTIPNFEILQKDIIEYFCDFISEDSIKFTGFSGEFRFVQREEKETSDQISQGEYRETVVAMCAISNMDLLVENINKRYNINLCSQPTHVTLYTKQKDLGIGINSQKDLEKLSKVVQIPELHSVIMT